MGSGDKLDQSPFAAGRDTRHVASQHRFERFRRLPFGMLRRQLLDAVECKGQLYIHGLLAP